MSAPQYSTTAASTCSKVVQALLLTWHFKSAKRYSIGLRSGDCGGDFAFGKYSFKLMENVFFVKNLHTHLILSASMNFSHSSDL